MVLGTVKLISYPGCYRISTYFATPSSRPLRDMFEACSVIPEHVSKKTRTRPEERVVGSISFVEHSMSAAQELFYYF